MKILLTGATGYIGKRLLPVLLSEGHHIVCLVRDRARLDLSLYDPQQISVVEASFLDAGSLKQIPEDIDAAYYLIHSMSSSGNDFESMERQSALNFRTRLDQTGVRQVVYLSGITNQEQLSSHLRSRKAVEDILSSGKFRLTTLRAGVIIGSGSASFEIIRDLVEKLPVMIAPRWLNTRSQPIAIRNVIRFLEGVLGDEESYGKSYDIGGPEVLSYREMLLNYARVRGLRRLIRVVPVMTPRLSSYWLYFITSTSYPLAVKLVQSMKIEVVCRENNLADRLGIELLTYREALERAFDRIEQHTMVSSWTDALSTRALDQGIAPLIQVPVHGCFRDQRVIEVENEAVVMDRIWSIGGNRGWYYATWLWSLRGFLDRMAGGVGLRRGRRSSSELSAGDALDFWRVLLADRNEKRLLLYAEMKLPGEAWLEFSIKEGRLTQTATFRPLGLWGRLYWYSVLPFHAFIFRGMIRRIAGSDRIW